MSVSDEINAMSRAFHALPPTGKQIERAVLNDRDRPCLFGVMGPCFHPKCLEAHYDTLRAANPTHSSSSTGVV